MWISACAAIPLLWSVLGLADKTEYDFVEDTSTFVAIHRGDDLLIGKLDSAGNFIRDVRWQRVKFKNMAFSHIPWAQIINFRRPQREHVYEFRSARLIKGELDKEGNFVPDLGSKVMDFKDYRYKKDPLFIYNLPGYFKEKNGKPE